jgi:hypothetical protein
MEGGKPQLKSGEEKERPRTAALVEELQHLVEFLTGLSTLLSEKRDPVLCGDLPVLRVGASDCKKGPKDVIRREGWAACQGDVPSLNCLTISSSVNSSLLARIFLGERGASSASRTYAP